MAHRPNRQRLPTAQRHRPARRPRTPHPRTRQRHRRTSRLRRRHPRPPTPRPRRPLMDHHPPVWRGQLSRSRSPVTRNFTSPENLSKGRGGSCGVQVELCCAERLGWGREHRSLAAGGHDRHAAPVARRQGSHALDGVPQGVAHLLASRDGHHREFSIPGITNNSDAYGT